MIIKTEFTIQNVVVKLKAHSCEYTGMWYQLSVGSYTDVHNVGVNVLTSISQECFDTRAEADQAFAIAVKQYS